MTVQDELFYAAAKLVVETQDGSTSWLQRKFLWGYNRAGRVQQQLIEAKVVAKLVYPKKPEVLIKDIATLEQVLQYKYI